MKYELAFLAGLTAGAVLGVVFAARSGKETRKAIREKAQQGANHIASATGKVGVRLKDAAAKGKDQIGDAVEAAKNAYHTKMVDA